MGRSIDSQRGSASETQKLNPEKAILESFLAKRGMVLYCKGKGAL
jgi:hypothetical protein